MPDGSVLRAPPGARLESPLCRLAQDLANLSGLRRYGLAFLLGVLLAGALPPVDLTPLCAVAFPGLLWLDDGSHGAGASFRLGYVFALGFFAAGLYWIASALFVDIAAFWWLLPFAVLGIPAVLALLPAAALGGTALLARHLGLGAAARIGVFAVAWSVAEWVRGHALTGLPWNLVGYAWSGGFPGAGAMLQCVAWVGIYGLSFVTVSAASLPALLGASSLSPQSPARRWAPAAGAVLLILLPWTAGAIRLADSPAALTGTWLRLVQPSIPETLKWDPAQAESNFRRLIDLSTAPADHSLAAVLWPEAASPFLLDRDPAHRARLAAIAPRDSYVIAGTLRASPPAGPPAHIWNSIEAIDSHGDILAHYDKAHLVPFGEYVPFRDVLPLKKLTPGTIDLSAGPGPQTLSLPALPPFAPLICYEAIFPGDIVDPRDRPAWLLNVTNDAWYGRSSGPFQHFAIARTRAVEEGLPLVRVANNGVSGVVDPQGRVLARINLDAIGYADVALPARRGRTLYSRAGDAIFWAMLAFGLVPALIGLRRRR
ncbi:MAG: apolipoprotein N-acyltransferase [Alphaproteobacteria bacterium]|nr:apolipoprotein N-acyltransferase [Alphaproteobacteria bacterium]